MEILSWLVDVVILIIVLYNIIIGFRRGLSGFALDFLVLGLSLGLSWFYYHRAGNILFSLFIFISALVLLTIVRYFLTGLARKKERKESKFSVFNQAGGAFLGFVRGAVILAVLFILIEIIPLGAPFERNFKQTIQTSRSYRAIQALVPLNKLTFLEKIRAVGELIYDTEALGELKKQAGSINFFSDKGFKIIIGGPETQD
ncbi:MAG: CvpA family protein [Candidatus Omnitrophota bacterium]|nr:CvpA family protein [Candidatus Omnitrophota bacterium]